MRRTQKSKKHVPHNKCITGMRTSGGHVPKTSNTPDHKRHENESVPNGFTMKAEITQSRAGTNDDTMIDLHFPKRLPWLLVALTLTFRLHYVLQPVNWWILHPDEIFQTTEVAHTEAFGYGFRPYEYLPPPGSDVTNITLSDARAKEIRLGMYSLRSFVLPKLLSYILLLSEWMGTTTSPFLVIKLFHVMVTSFLPLAVFQFTKTFFRSPQTAMIAAVFASTSMCLNVFGTHSLINSFLGTFVFFALSPLVEILNTVAMENCGHVTKCDLIGSTHEWNTNGDINANFNGVSMLNENSSNQNKRKRSNSKEDPCRTDHPITELFSFADGYFQIFSGCLLALCVYIRIDIILIPAVLVFVSMENNYATLKLFFISLKCYTAGFATGILIGGYYDVITYGHWFISPLQWLRFNVLSRTSGTIFGISPSFYYCEKLLEVEPVLIPGIGIILLNLALEIQTRQGEVQKESSTTVASFKSFANFRGLAIFLVLLFLYSGNNHKELRFLHNTIVFLYVCLARAIISLCKEFSRFSANQNNRQYCIYYVYLFISLFVSSHIYNFCYISKYDQSKWTYSRSADSNDVNLCLDFIRHQDEVTGVLLDRPIHLTGGYSILHRDVPIFALNKYEFMEFDNKSKVTLNKEFTRGRQTNDLKQVHVFGRISDFISIFNTPLLLKQLIKKMEYNYLVLRHDRLFEDTGYMEVFRAGNSRVLRRTFSAENEAKMAETADRIPVGTNATVLEYEGDWLRHFGLYSKAEERFLFSNRLDPSRIGPFRAMLSMFKKLGVASNYQSVLDACMQVHTLNNCLEQYQPLRFHDDYYRTLPVEDNFNI